MPDFELESAYEGFVAGIDEAGRGPWAGCVVAGAAVLPKELPEELSALNDSKKLTAKKRDQLYEVLMELPDIYTGLGIASVEEIDNVNILQATLLAMQRAYENLPSECSPVHVLVDGNKLPQKLNCNATAVIKGDGKSFSIAAASIVAKVTRDRYMQEIAKEYPGYGWEKNAGYGTKQHIEALERLGVTPYHRTSFAPIRKLISEKI
ncbi:MAG: ribonuclease HII [Alphaproteobacteria bacterium]|nr:ribonuclease HII [Alphaproteobacteria bacterium]